MFATIDIDMNQVQCISCEEQNEVINTYINKPLVLPFVEQPSHDVTDLPPTAEATE